ncbi:MAG: response regulator [Candidatus Limnocylindria bacterium]
MPESGELLVLVVDDEPGIRATVAEMLSLEGYAVDEAANGAEALAAVERKRPDLVLLDLRMPVLDGWGFVSALRSRGLTVPIVVMTAARDTGHWAEAIPAHGTLAKPFGYDELMAAVERARSAA